jgi:DNA polymerase-4
MSSIFHIDVNSAFLSWSAVKLLRDNPDEVDLRTIPSIVGGDRATRHGIVTAASIPAKKLGIRTADTVASALEKCPDLVTVPSDFHFYRECSDKFIGILRGYTQLVEQASIDEAYVDVGDIDDPVDLADTIRRQIREELGFTVNVGISTNCLLAKMASDFEKPDKTHTLYPPEIENAG